MAKRANATKKGDSKIYILDTSVLLHSPEALLSFGNNDVVLPLVVLDELDNFKKGSMELNRNARWVIHQLDDLRSQGPVSDGITLSGGGTLRVDVDSNSKSDNLIPAGFAHNVDNRILATALVIKAEQPQRKVIVVTKDINMRVKAEALGLNAEDYKHDQLADLSELYAGHREIDCSDAVIDELYQQHILPTNKLELNGNPLAPHEFVLLRGSTTALTRYDATTQSLSQLRDNRHDVWGLRPLNREQRYALEVLLDDQIPLVTLAGKAGTGKTILAIAAGLHKVCNEKTYRRLSIYRPVIPMGRDIGFLPGSEQEKLAPWMQPIYDNLEFLLAEGGGSGNKKGGHNRLDYLLDANILDIRALAYIRGRSLPQQFIVVDEAQNLTPHEAKTIVTRAGQGTKLVFTGDPYQIDHPYLDSTSNGLTYIVEKFKDYPIAAHVTLLKGERSPLAELATVLLEN